MGFSSSEDKRNKFIANMSSDSSDDEDDHILFQSIIKSSSRKLSSNIKKASKVSTNDNSGDGIIENSSSLKQKKSDPKTPKENMSNEILDIIERNEKMNEAGPDKIIDSSNMASNNLLSFDNKFYNV